MNRITNEQREAIVRKAVAERDALLDCGGYEARSFRNGEWLPWYPIDPEVYHNRQRWPRDGYEVRATVRSAVK